MTEQTLWQKVENTQKHYARLLAMPNPSTLERTYKVVFSDIHAFDQLCKIEDPWEGFSSTEYFKNLLNIPANEKVRTDLDEFLKNIDSSDSKTFTSLVGIPATVSRGSMAQFGARTGRLNIPTPFHNYGISHGKISRFARSMVKSELFDKLGVDGVLKIPAGEHRSFKGIEHSGEDIYALLKSLSGSEEKSFHWGNPTQYETHSDENGERVTRSVSNVIKDGKVLYTAIDEIYDESPHLKMLWDSYPSFGVTQRMPVFSRMPGRKTLLSLELHRMYGKKNPIMQFVKQNPHNVSDWSSEIDKFFNMRSGNLGQMDNRIVVTKSDMEMLKESIDADGYLSLEDGNQVSVTRTELTVTEFKIGGKSYDNMIYPYGEKKGGVKAQAKRTKQKRHSGRKK